MKNELITVNRNRRSDIYRREFPYTAHFPEKRSDKDRREEFDYSSVKTNERRSDIDLLRNK